MSARSRRGLRERGPRDRRAAEQRDQTAPFDCPMPPVLPTARIAQVGSAEDLLRCGIRTVKKRRLEPSSADFRSGAGRRPHLAERLNSLFTQSDGIALSSPGKLDDRFGYNCYCGIIAIDQTQLTQCIFERHCEHRDSVRPKDFLFSLGGVRKRHFTLRA